MLSKHPDVCKFPHGHSRKIEFILESESLDKSGMVCDFKVLRETVYDFLMAWDHALCMNTKDPQYPELKKMFGKRVVGFEGIDPTTEVMAKRIFDLATDKLAAYARNPGAAYPVSGGVRVRRVRVWETSSAWAEYEG